MLVLVMFMSSVALVALVAWRLVRFVVFLSFG